MRPWKRLEHVLYERQTLLQLTRRPCERLVLYASLPRSGLDGSAQISAHERDTVLIVGLFRGMPIILA
jgi:hypothetical protein